MKAVVVLLAVVAAISVPTASAHRLRFASARVAASDTLQVKANLTTQTTASSCPGGTPAGDVCFERTGRAAIPGLGTVTETYRIITADEMVCVPFSAGPVTMTVAGKGELEASLGFATACNVVPGALATFTITGGSGIYSGVSGSGTFDPVGGFDREDTVIDEDDFGGTSTDAWSAALTVPGLSFDLTPPVISGAVSKTVKVGQNAKFTRVAFRVSAQDAVDGTVPVSCKPRSGSRFKLGHTKVTCSATDSSANTATAKFKITVKRKHR